MNRTLFNLAANRISQYSFCKSIIAIYVDSLAFHECALVLNSNVVKLNYLYDYIHLEQLLKQ